MVERYVPEIVIGFVAPAGTDFERVTGLVSDRLAYYGYVSVRIRLSDFLLHRAQEAGRIPAGPVQDYGTRTKALQAEGNLFREESHGNDALAFVAVNEIVAARTSKNGAIEDPSTSPLKLTAYLLWSFKTPEEIATVRAIYGSRFFAISVHTPRQERVDTLARKITAARHNIGSTSAADRATAEEIVAADEREELDGEGDSGQNVRNAYPLADFFVDPESVNARPESIGRAVDIIFGHPFLTPTRDEFGMFVANAAALRSAELGRQVGAAITNDLGDILATGMNEVPAAGGGQYGADTAVDEREFVKGFDSSDELREALAQQIEEELRKAGLLSKEASSEPAIQAALRATHIRGLTEFGRALHAEASALLDAARRGVPTRRETIYVTTFPCHQCTRLVIAAGVKRLVYIYPYPKSLAERLHDDAIQVDGGTSSTAKIPFEPFLGVAPTRYVRAFTAPKRKNGGGKAVPEADRHRSPRLDPGDENGIWEANTYIVREQNAVKKAGNIFKSDAEAHVATGEA